MPPKKETVSVKEQEIVKKGRPPKTKEVVPEKKETVSVKEQFDMLFSEYKVGLEHTKRYADYANLTLNFTYLVLGAMIYWITYGKSLHTYKFLCIYLMPIYIYIVGLIYIYTQFVIGKVEYFLMCLESEMKQLAVKNDVTPIRGWNMEMKKDGNSSNFLVYGFIFGIFIFIPPIAIFIGHTNSFFAGDLSDNANFVNWSFTINYYFPWLLYTIYIYLGVMFIRKNMKIRKKKQMNNKRGKIMVKQFFKKLLKVSRKILVIFSLVLSVNIILMVVITFEARIVNKINSTIKTVNGIQESTYIELGGNRQYVQIRGQDKNNPLILFVHGGPANPLAYLTYYYQKDLENKYTIVHWDQRGSGRTFYENAVQGDLSSKQIVEDMNALVDYLLNRFSQKKIIILGHSWGTIIGSKYVQMYPEKVFAYIAVSKVVNTMEGIKISGEEARKRAIQQNNKKAIDNFNILLNNVNTINEYNPNAFKYYVKLKGLTLEYLPYEKQRSAFITLWTGISSPDFSKEDLKWFLKQISIDEFEKISTNLIEECFSYDAYDYPLNYEVPIFFMSGMFDRTTPEMLVKKYFNDITATQKYFVTIETGHSPYLESPRVFCEMVIQLLDLVEKK